jgi:hypothetical protein
VTDLEDDIARIAALRGRSPADYAGQRRFIHEHHLEGLLRMGDRPQLDLEALDELPTPSRTLITTWERPINALAWLQLLQEHEDEGFVIRTFRAWYAKRHGHEGDGPRRRPRRRLS